MPVSDFYVEDRALEKFQIDGPLQPYLGAFADWMKKYGYCRIVARRHLRNVAHFNYYLSESGRSQMPFSEIDVRSFCDKHIATCHCYWWGQIRDGNKAQCSISRFRKFLRVEHGFEHYDRFFAHTAIYRQYLKWMNEEQHLASATVRCNAAALRTFLSWYQETSSNSEITSIRASDVERFLLRDYDPKKSRHNSKQTALRGFFKFCHQQGLIDRPLHHAVPTIKRYKMAVLPKAIEDSEVVKLLKNIDRTTRSGKRAYAIIRLLFEFGIRGVQVRQLKLGDIDWRNEKVYFAAVKGSKDSEYSLSVETGNALLDYLKSVRPKSAHEEIFLTLQAPFAPLSAVTLCVLLKTEMKKAGVQSPHFGAHCFRHGFVTRLLGKGTSLKNIADIIGHRSIHATFVYSKVDANALAEVALTLPGGLE